MTWLLLATILNAAYTAALPAPAVFYIANVLLHLALGAATVIWLCFTWRRNPRIIPLLLSGILGVYLIFAGATSNHRPALWTHVTLAIVGLVILLPRWRPALATLAIISAALRFGMPETRIHNPESAPLSMTEEGAGPHSPFWPSSAQTNTGGLIPSDFFMDSELCGQCHKDIYEQWKGSMHHFASFNNRFYRSTIEHMQELSGTQGSKWCAGCHDHAVFFNGRFDRLIKEQVNTAEAQNGLGCVSCHSIVHVASSMGNGDFTIKYPPLHRIASSHNPWIRNLDNFLTYLNPEPHRQTFMQPFMRKDNPEFCATCHKVHLDEPVNHYRWLRGFNEYDNWQASGVSGQGARSFYYPEKSSTCSDCHMPLAASNDPGNKQGQIHSHRFPAANTAIPYVNHDNEQLRVTEQFLKSGFITVDLFAAAPVDDNKSHVETPRRTTGAPVQASTFAVGEEAEQTGPVVLREVGKLAAPIDAPGVKFQPGRTIRVDAVVRTRKIGHFFPAGTVDGYDVWLDFKAIDATGRVLAWSGQVEDHGRGPVEPGAHFYRSYQLDGDGRPINKRNAWQTRSVLYVRLIPPGAADTVHFQLPIPADARGPIKLETNLNYRKFSRYYTQFAFAGVAKPGPVTIDSDGRDYSFDSAPVPDIPIVTIASAQSQIELGDPNWTPRIRQQDRERWNDWGIGLLLQGDLKAAEYAFRCVTEAEPAYADGWLNVGRALIQEGETDAARPFVEKALALQPTLARGHFFLAMIQKAAGDYDGALRSLAETVKQYPRDRVAQNQSGRILFLQRRFAEAVPAFRRALDVDPEDVQAHYNLMLCYQGLGDSVQAGHEQKLFLRFKADEASQALTAKPRLLSPEDNNERQSIHDHVSLVPVRGSSDVSRSGSR
jgi:Flp pilus assembly protein TadD